MDAANTLIEAALVHADEDTVMRQQIVEIVRRMVETELGVMVMNGAMTRIVDMSVKSLEWEIKKMALRAIKEQFNNPQQIY